MTTLTTLEQKALDALVAESANTGHDFGVMEEVAWKGSRKALGGLVTSLQAKGFIDSVAPTEKTDDGYKYTQYVLNMNKVGAQNAVETNSPFMVSA